jgi:glutamate synthase domain-containing protein 2
MNREIKNIPANGMIIAILVLVNAVILSAGFTENKDWNRALWITVPLLAIAVLDRIQKKHALLRNYPLLGRLRYLFESIRPEIRQYFFESDLDGKPFNRRQRSIVYQRSKNEKDTVAFGMQSDPTQPGYEWVAHSLYPVRLADDDLRITIGNDQCEKPYSASILNIGAMSFGALSKTAIQALNAGARKGGFAHNTGEGGISEYHLNGGDLIWQIGTGYFGCRNASGKFDALAFTKNAMLPEVKMIELKLSQGAKPGAGGILPASKNTKEIAGIRLVKAGETVYSPSKHSAFDSPEEMMFFLQRLRKLSGGKPVGFKLCLGSKPEFIELCNAMISTGVIPDFITVDGGEGGTGAASLEFSDHVGMPLHEALAFVKKAVDFYQLSDEIKIIAAGKIITGFDILKALSLGASCCYSARGMMMSLGCIQAMICDSGRCPVGIATQDASLYKGIDPADKKIRVANFHAKTVAATRKLMEACGFMDIETVDPSKIFRKINMYETKSFSEIYFYGRSGPVTHSLYSSLN